MADRRRGEMRIREMAIHTIIQVEGLVLLEKTKAGQLLTPLNNNDDRYRYQVEWKCGNIPFRSL
jgi:hypothetical protein